jgi:hypothetical protein
MVVIMNNQEQAKRSIREFERTHRRKATPKEKARIKELWGSIRELTLRSGPSYIGMPVVVRQGNTVIAQAIEKMRVDLCKAGWKMEQRPDFWLSPDGRHILGTTKAWVEMTNQENQGWP